jgi:hypothetical protein
MTRVVAGSGYPSFGHNFFVLGVADAFLRSRFVFEFAEFTSEGLGAGIGRLSIGWYRKNQDREGQQKARPHTSTPFGVTTG